MGNFPLWAHSLAYGLLNQAQDLGRHFQVAVSVQVLNLLSTDVEFTAPFALPEHRGRSSRIFGILQGMKVKSCSLVTGKKTWWWRGEMELYQTDTFGGFEIYK